MTHGVENTVQIEVRFDVSATCIRQQRSYILVTASHPDIKQLPPTNANEDGIAHLLGFIIFDPHYVFNSPL